MTGMTQRVAVAICLAEGRAERMWPNYVGTATAAIGAMRYNPNGDELLHPWAPYLDAFVGAFDHSYRSHGFRESVMAGINAMVDAALPKPADPKA